MFRTRRLLTSAFIFAVLLTGVPSCLPAQTNSVLFVADRFEPVKGAISVPSTPTERSAAFSLLERALQNSDMHMTGTAPFHLDATFNTGGNVNYAGLGQLTETWLSGKSWRWTARLGSYSQIQIGYNGSTFAEKKTPIPLRIQMLRNAIFWPVRLNSAAEIRTAAVLWNGKPATCLLTSGMMGLATTTQTRLWEETEYCIDNASGLLQVYSIAPGSYAVYEYANAQFHGHIVPDRIMFVINGATVLDSQIRITDAGSVNASMLTPTQQMIANGPAITLRAPERFPIEIPSASINGKTYPVIILASIDVSGNVLEEELASSSDGALVQSALDLVRKTTFPAQGEQRQAYINVKFTPVSQGTY